MFGGESSTRFEKRFSEHGSSALRKPLLKGALIPGAFFVREYSKGTVLEGQFSGEIRKVQTKLFLKLRFVPIRDLKLEGDF